MPYLNSALSKGFLETELCDGISTVFSVSMTLSFK